MIFLTVKSESDTQTLSRSTNLTIIPGVLYTYKLVNKNNKFCLDLGFHTITNQILRIRGINASDIQTDQGQKAKDFVVSKLSDIDFIVIKTYSHDKYSRYVTDVFYMKNENDFSTIINEGNFLNQELLDNELAVKYYRY